MTKQLAPFAVIYTDEETGRQVIERHETAVSVSKRLNALWGRCSGHGPERHKEARGVIGARLSSFQRLSGSERKGGR